MLDSIQLAIDEKRRGLTKGLVMAFGLLLVAIVANRIAVSGRIHPVGFPYNCSMLLALIHCWLYAHRGGRVDIAGASAIAVFTAIFMGLSFLSGGLASPVALLGGIIPLLGLIMVGPKTCLVSIIVNTFFYLLMFDALGTPEGFGLKFGFSPEERMSMEGVYALIIMGITVWAGWHYRMVRNDLLLHIQDMASLDFLTGLPNRRRTEEVLELEFKRAQRDEVWLAIVMIDIDHFKRINDSYGHQAGDSCLQYVAHLVKAELKRPGDLVGRYGGEEFICVLPNTPAIGARELAERIRAVIAASPFTLPDGREIQVTVTIGVKAAICRANVRLHDLIQEADELLYIGKKAGRNRVIFFPEPLPLIRQVS